MSTAFGLTIKVKLAMLLSAVIFGSAVAQGSAPQVDAIELLQRAQIVAKTSDYQGVFAHQRNGQMRSFRLTHRYIDGEEFERLEVLDNSPREYLRHNGRVLCLIPANKMIVAETQHQERFPAVLMASVDELGTHYELTAQSHMSRVAGRECQRIRIMPKDQHRSQYELCLDHKTGLLLEAQMYDEHGMIVEHIAFTQVQVGKPIAADALEPAWPTHDWKLVERTRRDIDLRSQGWFLREPPGYRSMAEIERQFGDGRRVNQVILTDGLANISIFIEPYQQNLSHHQINGASRSGAVNLYGKQYESYWVMVAGEVPAATIKQVAESIVRSGPLHQR
jgi:sigma-E factor negative regulatory protein RseB